MPEFDSTHFSVYKCFNETVSKKVREGFILKRCKMPHKRPQVNIVSPT